MEIISDKVLFLGAHPDDLENGCGGLLNQVKGKDVECVIFSNTLNYSGNDNIIDELDKSMKLYGLKYTVLDFTNMNFPLEASKIRESLYTIKNSFKPNVIFSTSPKSVNPDHTILGESVKAVFQEQTVLFYEVLRGDYEHLPELYIELSSEDLMMKLKALSYYKSQEYRSYTKPDRITSFAQMRGAQINCTYAESFEIYRMIKRE